MDKAITTAIFITVGMIMALMLFNVAYPATMEGTDAIANMSGRMADQMRTQIMVIHAGGELDSSGVWQDVNSNGLFEVVVWVKNVGDTRVMPLESVDLFFGQEGNFSRIPHESRAGGTYPRWTGTVETGDEWQPSGTLRIVVQYPVALASGRYFVKVSLPNGVTSEYFLGI